MQKSRESAKRETRPDDTPRLSRQLDLPRLHARSGKKKKNYPILLVERYKETESSR